MNFKELLKQQIIFKKQSITLNQIIKKQYLLLQLHQLFH